MALASQGGMKASTAHNPKDIRKGAKPNESKDAGGYVKEGVRVAGNPANKKLPK